ncbi:MAG: site-specific integrase [Solirubrobacteraceae bacterium]
MHAQPTPDGGVLLDRRGRRRSLGNTPGARTGRPPGNKGRRFPANPPTIEEIVRLLQTCSDDDYGMRCRALLILLWRAGLRISEALALTEQDLDPAGNAITVRNGKGGKRRIVGIDDWGWSELQPWLERRRELPVGELICVLSGPTLGRAMSDSCARRDLHNLGAKAGIRKRVAPHQLRHAHAVELAREGISMPLLQRQLGHSNLATTATYLQGIDPHEVIERISARPTPMVPARSVL